MYELNRLCRVDGFKLQLSQFVSKCLRELKKENWIIVSYSDTAMNHHGYVYQACNFIYTGCTKERTEFVPKDIHAHSRHYSGGTSEYRKIRSAKHRYVYFCTSDKKMKRKWRKALNYEVLPYPKGDNSNYVLGEYIKNVFVDKNGNRIGEEEMGLIDSIKNDALKSGGNIQTTEGNRLDAILNKMFYLEKNIDEETKFVHDVMTRGLESQERVGLHASAVIDKGDGKFCTRQQVLSLFYEQLQGEQLPVNLVRIFEEGNAVHEKWQRLFIRAGYAKAKTCDRTRFDKDYCLSYTPDVIVSIPEFYPGLMVVEIKSMNTFSFQQQYEHASGHKQLELYMHLLRKAKGSLDDPDDPDFKKGFTLLDSKNDQKFRTVIYDYEPETVAPFLDRLDDIRVAKDKFEEEKKMLKRVKSCTDSRCEMASKCPMRDACWNVGNGRILVDEKNKWW